jgi:hypothetical protein
LREHDLFWLMLRRFYRLRDAPSYLGMDPNRFNSEVRPYLVQIPIGIQGIAFDRLELDAWANHYRSRNGRPPRKEASWQKELPGSRNETESGVSINVSKDMAEYAKVAERTLSTKRSATWPEDSNWFDKP